MVIFNFVRRMIFVLASASLFLSCTHIKKEKKLDLSRSISFSIRDDSLVYLSLQPLQLLPVLRQMPFLSFLVGGTKLKNIYLDYSSQSLRIKGIAQLPQQWINANLWQKRKLFENHSTLRESHYKFKNKNLYLSIPNKKEIYLYTKEFYSPMREELFYVNARQDSSSLIEQSKKFPLFMKIFNLSSLLENLGVAVPSIFRLPFDEMSLLLNLTDKKAELNFTFATCSDSKPPVLAVRFLLNYLFSNLPPSPLSEAWKTVPILASPFQKNAVTACLTLDQKELIESLDLYASSLSSIKAESGIKNNHFTFFRK